MRRWLLVVVVGLVGIAALTADASAAKLHRASRYDVTLELGTDGSMRVTERVVFVFGPDSFTTVFREIPTRRTDGITVLSVSMDGIPFGRGKGPGQFETRRVENGQGPRVIWHFAPVTGSDHTFELSYRVGGVIIHSNQSDRLEWRILPTRHEYPIDCSQVSIVPPAMPELFAPPSFDPPAAPRADPARLAFSRCQFDPDRSWQLAMEFPSGSLAREAPRWQQTAERGRRWAPAFATIAGVLLVTGVMALFFYWNNNRHGVASGEPGSRRPTPPADLPVAIAGALTRPGASAAWSLVVATLLDFARRGIVRIEESDSKWGQRQFRIVKLQGGAGLTGHEQVVMDMLFTTRHGPVDSVRLADLRRSAPRHWRGFRRQVRSDLRGLGYVNADREHALKQLQWIGVALIVVALLGLGGAAVAVSRFQGWPLLVPASVLLVGLATIGLGVAQSPLSDEGLRQAASWRAFGGYLRDVGRGKASSLEPQLFTGLLPYAAAFGAAIGWAKLLKKSGAGGAPGWIHFATSGTGDEMAGVIAALSSATSAGSHVDGGVSAGAGAAGGAAGGGASGAS